MNSLWKCEEQQSLDQQSDTCVLKHAAPTAEGVRSPTLACDGGRDGGGVERPVMEVEMGAE